MSLNITAVTNIGQRVDNQDNYWSATLRVSPINGDTEYSEAAVLCVCDGMGGLNDGGYASRSVIKAIKDVVNGNDTNSSTISPDDIEEAVRAVNTRLYNETFSQGLKQMGTTCTILIMVDNEYRIIHIGDTRAYHLFGQGRTSRILTKDHTAFNMYQERNAIKFTDGKWFINGIEVPHKKVRSLGNKLTRCVGVKPDIDIVRYEGTYSNGDGFLLASDGFWHLLDKVPQWAEKVLASKDLEGMLSHYIEQFKVYNGSLETGEKDNQTVVVVRA